MGTLQFPETQYFIEVTASGTDQHIGTLTMAHDAELGNLIVWLTKVGTNAGSERFRLKLFPTTNLEAAWAVSDWVDVSDFDNLETASDWIGWLKFDFARQHLRSGEDYAVCIEAENYTNPNDDSFYFAVALDWPEAINTPSVSTERGAAMSVLAYR